MARTKPGGIAAKPVSVGMTEDQRRAWIAEGAYYKAEKRGFFPAHVEQDWLEAEQDFEALSQGDLTPPSH